MTRASVARGLYAVGTAVIVISLAYVINHYFGAPDEWDNMRSSFDTLTAVLEVLRDLALELGLGVLILAFGWYVDRGGAEARSRD